MKIALRPSRQRSRDAELGTPGEPRHPAPRWLMALVASSLAAGTLMAAVVPGWIGAHRGEAAQSSGAALPAKRSADALRLYELPPVNVVADRRTELARIAHDEELMRLRQARSKAAAKPPA